MERTRRGRRRQRSGCLRVELGLIALGHGRQHLLRLEMRLIGPLDR